MLCIIHKAFNLCMVNHFFFFFWLYNPQWSLASSTVCLETLLQLPPAVSSHSHPLFQRSFDTSSSHLYFDRPSSFCFAVSLSRLSQTSSIQLEAQGSFATDTQVLRGLQSKIEKQCYNSLNIEQLLQIYFELLCTGGTTFIQFLQQYK